MKEIKIKFTSFWPGFDQEDNFIINILKKHYRVILTDSPDYLFCSCFDNDFLNYDCVRIVYTGENWFPDLSYYDYAIGFDYLDYGDRFLRYPNWAIPELYKKDVKRMNEKHLKVSDQKEINREFCSFVVSGGKFYVDKTREDGFYKLSEYKKVNSGGRFLNNIGEPNGVKDKFEFQNKHKFALCFENTSMPGYTTEKIVQAFAAETVPIYWGDPKVKEIFNEKAFVFAMDYKNLDELKSAVEEIDQDDSKYLSMLREAALNNQDEWDNHQRKLEDFLLNIFEQEYEKAFRRDRIGFNKKKEDELRAYKYAFDNTFKKKTKKVIKLLIKRKK